MRFLLTSMLWSLLCVAAAAVPARQNPGPPPNVVFILVDDLGFMDVTPNNPESFYDTPNIEKLARSSMRFSQGYAACPVCSPTRASIFTGKYPVRTGITDYISPNRGNQPEKWQRKTSFLPAPYRDRMEHSEVTMAEAFKDAGYATFFAGKWHLGPEGHWPEDQGFDVNRGGITRGGPYGGKRYFSPYGNERLADGPDGEHLPDRLASETAAFIHAHKDRPFFAFLSFYSVHTPLMAREDLKQKYQAKRAEGPPEAWGQERERRVRLVQNHAVYAGMVEAMDQAVGKVLDCLEENGLSERTIVVFFSDNGGLSTSEGSPTSNIPYRAGKGWLYEGGIREPLLVRAPGVTEAGSLCTVPVISTDFYPTLLELAGLPARPEQHLDGVSLTPLLHGAEVMPARDLLWHYPHYGNQGARPGAALRDGPWKLIEWYGEGSAELFRLDVDPGEHYDLADKEPERVAAMHQRLRAWQKETGALFPTPNPAAAAALHPAGAALAGLGWMAGHWVHQTPALLQEEAWLAPVGGHMLGVHRDRPKGGNTAFEFLQLFENAGEVIYRAWPSAKTAVDFRLIGLEQNRAVFENLEHDYPTRIEYRRAGDQLIAEISGEIDGALEVRRWTWKLQP